jgi:hypothetical protein
MTASELKRKLQIWGQAKIRKQNGAYPKQDASVVMMKHLTLSMGAWLHLCELFLNVNKATLIANGTDPEVSAEFVARSKEFAPKIMELVRKTATPLGTKPNGNIRYSVDTETPATMAVSDNDLRHLGDTLESIIAEDVANEDSHWTVPSLQQINAQV